MRQNQVCAIFFWIRNLMEITFSKKKTAFKRSFVLHLAVFTLACLSSSYTSIDQSSFSCSHNAEPHSYPSFGISCCFWSLGFPHHYPKKRHQLPGCSWIFGTYTTRMGLLHNGYLPVWWLHHRQPNLLRP